MLPGGADSAVAVAISDDGLTVAGQATMPDGTLRGFVWVHGEAAVYIPPLAGFTQTLASDITADGTTIYGYCEGSGDPPVVAFKWTAGGGTTDFSGGAMAQALCCSADGSVVFGNQRDPGTGHERAAKWTAGGGLVVIGGWNEEGTPDRILPNVCTNDGSVAFGLLFLDPQPAFPAQDLAHLGSWSAGTGVVDHGGPPGDDYLLALRPTAITPSGTQAVVSTSATESRAFLWTSPSTWTALTVAPTSEAYGISADASTVAGDFTEGDAEPAGVWTAAGGWVALPGLPGGNTGAYGIAPDGTVVFGYAIDAGGIEYAAVWRLAGAGGGGATTTLEQDLVWLDWSDSAGHNWSNPVSQSLGATGRYNTSLQFQRLGYGRSRVFRLTWSAPVATSLTGAWIDVTPGQT